MQRKKSTKRVPKYSKTTFDPLKIHWFARDKSSDLWYDARVISIDKNGKARVRFKGYDSSDDIYIKIGDKSNLIAQRDAEMKFIGDGAWEMR